VSQEPTGLQSIYTYDRSVDSRIVSGVVAVKVARPLWLAGGIGVLQSTLFELTTYTPSFTLPQIGPIERTDQWSTAAGVIGADLQWLEYRRMMVLLGMRANLSKRDRGTQVIGLGPIILRPSIGIEIGF
jgi:hypothetical protein